MKRPSKIAASAVLASGTYDAARASQADRTKSLTVLCSRATAYLDSRHTGSGAAASAPTRKFSTNGNSLSDELYSDNGHCSMWGNTVRTNTVTGAYALLLPAPTVSGQIAPDRALPAGNYTDPTTITFTY